MAILSPDQINFLQKQSISLSRVFDASGMSTATYKVAMRELDMIMAIGVSPCSKAGHTIRLRAGHCAQCNTQGIAFLLRHHDRGEVYVAASAMSGLVKVGTSKYSRARMTNLNSYGYGGATDWKIQSIHTSEKAGRVEFLAQTDLNYYRTSRTYVKTGLSVHCQELFTCDATIATAAIHSALKKV